MIRERIRVADAALARKRVGEDGGELDLVGLHGVERGVGDTLRSEKRDVGGDAQPARLERLQGDAPGDAQGRGEAPEKCPPPATSWWPRYFTCAGQSAWPGRGLRRSSW